MGKTARRAQRARGMDVDNGAKGPAMSTPGLKSTRRPDNSGVRRPSPRRAEDRGVSVA